MRQGGPACTIRSSTSDCTSLNVETDWKRAQRVVVAEGQPFRRSFTCSRRFYSSLLTSHNLTSICETPAAHDRHMALILHRQAVSFRKGPYQYLSDQMNRVSLIDPRAIADASMKALITQVRPPYGTSTTSQNHTKHLNMLPSSLFVSPPLLISPTKHPT
jgi:hypothetical protein